MGLWLAGGCDRKNESSGRADFPTEPTPTQVEDLKRKKEEIARNIERMKSDQTCLRREIRELEEIGRQVEADLAAVDAFKKQVADNLAALKKRYGKEFEGIRTDLDLVPLNEVADSMNRRINELAEENVTLKRKLEETTK